jgi:hypothetical protein
VITFSACVNPRQTKQEVATARIFAVYILCNCFREFRSLLPLRPTEFLERSPGLFGILLRS